jgi:hypothetical protein
MGDLVTADAEAHQLVVPSRWVHAITGAATIICFFVTTTFWSSLLDGAVQAFGTIGLFITAYGVLFSIIEVLRTQSATVEAAKAARRAAARARTPYDMRDVSECMTAIETTLYAVQHGGAPRSQPLSRIIRLYTAVFEDRYANDKSPERVRIGIVHSYVPVKMLKKTDALLEKTLAEMLSDLAAKGGNITMKAI